MAKDIYLRKILGEDTFAKIRKSKILMVGAGGIGCELLKDLMLTGYGEIHIVDLDTISLSNLNRQFLFRKKDIDKSKSMTIAKAVQSFNYLNTKLIPHHGNIMDTNQFSISWWSQFDCIFNALDNLEARRYVNKLCLFLKKPLMESGTTGFEGQVQPIYPYFSECFDCQEKATPKQFPVCTIRSTPSQPIHCITWAKEFLFHQLFDELEPGTNDSETIQNASEDQQEVENLVQGANELIELKNIAHGGDSVKFTSELINKIFKIDIERLLLIESLWKTRVKPEPLNIEDFEPDLSQLLQSKNSDIINQDTKLWSILENLYVLIKSCHSLQKRIAEGETIIKFDKDDEDTLNFVSASSNIRSYIFHIELKTKFDIKEIAGNIIPAIATTNAIISGFSCLCGTQYFKQQPNSSNFQQITDESSTIFISIKPNKYITAAKLVKPNIKCASSSLLSRGILEITAEDLEQTLEWFVDSIMENYKYEDEAISIQLDKSKLIYDVDFDDNLQKKLSTLGFKDGGLILIQDDNDVKENLELYININSQTKFPVLDLRQKLISKSEKSPENDPENPESFLDTIMIEQDSEIIEIEQPSSKKRRLN